MSAIRIAAFIAAGAVSALALAAAAQDAPPPMGGPQGGPRAAGYLGDSAPDALAYMPPPPAADSADGAAELQIFRDTRALAGTPRWDMAARDAAGDAASMFGAFACALGARIAPDAAPATANLIRRAMADVSPTIGAEKDRYTRPRPFTVAEGATCVDAEDLRDSGAYPSGHSTVGWTWALLLAELAPDRAAQIVGRGRAFGESRVVCGVHYPSDVAAGQTAATAVFAALQSSAEFVADRDAARAELDALRAAAPAPDAAQCAAEEALVRVTPW